MNMRQVRTLVVAVILILVISMTMMSFKSYQGIEAVHGTYGSVIRSEIPKLEVLQGITYESSTIQRGVLRLLVESGVGTDTESKNKIVKMITDARHRNEENLKKIEPLLHAEEGKKIFKSLQGSLIDYNQKADRVIELALAGKAQEAYTYNLSATLPAFNGAQKVLDQFVDFNVNIANKEDERADLEARGLVKAMMWIGTIAVILSLFGGGYAIFLLRSTMRRLERVSESIEESSLQTASASSQVSSSSQSLAEGASEQAASLEETSSSLEEMSSMTKRNAENAQNAKDLANHTKRSGDSGLQEMNALRGAMGDIQTSSKEISKIIKTIDEIAFQTNILALNAAVEAARAGEHGLGFAVVADEVRNLAQRAAAAARETAEKIEGAIEKTEHGSQLTHRVATSLEEIVDKAKQVDQLIGEIALASVEQSRGVDQINMAIGQMDKVTQSSAANAEETAAAAQQSSAQVETLHGLVEELNGIVGSEAIHPQKNGVLPLTASGREKVEVTIKSAKRGSGLHALPPVSSN